MYSPPSLFFFRNFTVCLSEIEKYVFNFLLEYKFERGIMWMFMLQLSTFILPWSYCTSCAAVDASLVYFSSTLFFNIAEPRNRLKQPGLHKTQPVTCSVAFCSQWLTAYSNIWYHTIGPVTNNFIHVGF